jgi:hypothetical protein
LAFDPVDGAREAVGEEFNVEAIPPGKLVGHVFLFGKQIHQERPQSVALQDFGDVPIAG